MPWQVLAVGAPLLFVAYQSLSKLFPSDTSPFLVNAYASALGTVIMVTLYLITSADKSFALSSRSLMLALAIGAMISVGNAAIIKAYLLGAPQSAFTSIYYPLLIIYALIVSLLFWHERLNWYQALGVVFSTIGIFLVVYFKS